MEQQVNGRCSMVNGKAPHVVAATRASNDHSPLTIDQTESRNARFGA